MTVGGDEEERGGACSLTSLFHRSRAIVADGGSMTRNVPGTVSDASRQKRQPTALTTEYKRFTCKRRKREYQCTSIQLMALQ